MQVVRKRSWSITTFGSMSFALAVWLLCVLLFILLPGCRAFDVGPSAAEKVGGMMITSAAALLENYQAERTEADVGGEINDPRVTFKTFMGNGFLVQTEASLEGLDLHAAIESTGTGTGEKPDVDNVERLARIMLEPDRSSAERHAVIQEAIADWIRGMMQQPGLAPEPEPAPGDGT